MLRPSDYALEQGIAMAEQIFKKRGNNSEAHIGKEELAALLALAYARGTEMANGSYRFATEPKEVA